LVNKIHQSFVFFRFSGDKQMNVNPKGKSEETIRKVNLLGHVTEKFPVQWQCFPTEEGRVSHQPIYHSPDRTLTQVVITAD
jgi:hypothetical protein